MIWHGFRFQGPGQFVIMKNQYSVKEKLTLILLAAGVLCFGAILPDSFSDHVKLVHFSAHFGMSFLLALCFYFLCTIQLRFSKIFSYAVLISATLLIGVFYKSWEIATQGTLERVNLSRALEMTGVMTSMSQNLSGLMAAMFMIEGLVHRNLIMSVLRTGNIYTGPGAFHGISRMNPQPGSIQGGPHGGSFPAGSQFSPEASEN
jgi:hypothetical protein